MRTISILAVILIHTTTRTIEATHNNLTGFPWTLFLNQISRFAVPLFFIISGFVLELNYNYHNSYLSFFKKRVSTILVPYVFWSLIYYYFVYTQNTDSLYWVFFTGNASYQLYFIPTVAIFYLTFPFLHKVHKLITSVLIMVPLAIWQISLLYHDYFIKQFRFQDPIRITILNFFVFIFGMYAARNIDKILEFVKKWKYFFLLTTIAMGVYVFFEGKIDYQSTGNYLAFYSQWRPSVLIYSLSLFAFLLYFFSKPHRQLAIFEHISRLSYPAFFIHVIVLEQTWKYIGLTIFNLIRDNIFGKIIFDPLFFLIVATISFLICTLFRKIRLLPKITG